MEVSRRKFLKMSAQALGGGIVLYVASPAILRVVLKEEATGERSAELAHEKHSWAFAVDIRKCIGCFKCLQACKLENRVSLEPEKRRTWVERYAIGEDGTVFVDSVSWGQDGPKSLYPNAKHEGQESAKSFFVPKLCNQCDNPHVFRSARSALPSGPGMASSLWMKGVALGASTALWHVPTGQDS